MATKAANSLSMFLLLSSDSQAELCFREGLSRKSVRYSRPLIRNFPLSCWLLNDLKSQMGGPPLEIVNLPLAVGCLVDLRSLIHKLHPKTQHTIDQSGELGCHRLDRDRCF